MSLAAQMTEFLDTHPEVFKAMNDEPELLNIVTRYADQLQPFLSRYAANTVTRTVTTSTTLKLGDMEHSESKTTVEPISDESPVPAEPAAEGQQDPAESGAMQAQIDTLTAQLSESQKEVARLTAEREALTKQRDELTARISTTDELTKTLTTERDEAQRKLEAITAGEPPVSSKSAETEPAGTLMQRARKKK